MRIFKIYENKKFLSTKLLKFWSFINFPQLMFGPTRYYEIILWNLQYFLFVFVLYCTKRRCSQIKLFVFWQPWATTVRSSMPQQLSLPVFKNVITPGRFNCFGMEYRTIVAHGCRTKKNNMWHGSIKCSGLWPPAFPHS